MNRTADLDAALGFVTSRVNEQATLSGEPLSVQQRGLVLPNAAVFTNGLQRAIVALLPSSVGGRGVGVQPLATGIIGSRKVTASPRSLTPAESSRCIPCQQL
jgi:hypothetical protein